MNLRKNLFLNMIIFSRVATLYVIFSRATLTYFHVDIDCRINPISPSTSFNT
jgi:hypothetical protein